MCTAISWKNKDHYFGRTLDIEYQLDGSVVITPRNYQLDFRYEKSIGNHCAIIGMATVIDNYPLYYEATNEKGLSVAGLNFPGNTYYQKFREGYHNIEVFELIPWILSNCRTVSEAKSLVEQTNILGDNFNDNLPSTGLHWIISDSNDNSITVESLKDGIKIYDNDIGVLTNNPTFDYHRTNLNNYINLTRNQPENRFSPYAELRPFSCGMGALGLPGDLSSVSRFVRVAFNKLNSDCESTEEQNIMQFFHILGSVTQTRGCSLAGNGNYQVTVYTSCCNTDKGIYYYITYTNNQITAVDINHENLESSVLIQYPMHKKSNIMFDN